MIFKHCGCMCGCAIVQLCKSQTLRCIVQGAGAYRIFCPVCWCFFLKDFKVCRWPKVFVISRRCTWRFRIGCLSSQQQSIRACKGQISKSLRLHSTLSLWHLQSKNEVTLSSNFRLSIYHSSLHNPTPFAGWNRRLGKSQGNSGSLGWLRLAPEWPSK